MNQKNNLPKLARQWHHKVSSILFVFFFCFSITGILLGWKAMLGSKIYKSEAKQETAKSTKEWLPLDSLQGLASLAFQSKMPNEKIEKSETFNANLEKGYVRFAVGKQFNVQVNAKTGELQSITKKAPEWITNLHDGGWIDDLFSVKNDVFKRIYSTLMGLSLFFLTFSGLLMIFKPKKIVKTNNEELVTQ
jgi:uncharacterized iron-regulated membrane protein